MRAIALVLAVGALLAVSARGDHCDTYGTSAPEGDVAGTYYVDVDICQVDCLHGLLAYEESNGIPGLQRGDEVVDDTCHASIRPDTIVF